MRTEDLIRFLAEDTRRAPPLERTVWLAWLGAAAIATVLFLVALGPRPDWAEVAMTLRFLFKPVIPLVLAVVAIGAAARLARPSAPLGGWSWLLLVPASLLLAAVVVELLVRPAAQWPAVALGESKLFCLVTIPSLSLLPLALILWALGHGASTRPVASGALAGLTAAGLATSLYGIYCPEDSPLFVAIWYAGAVGITSGIGAFAGGRLLRW